MITEDNDQTDSRKLRAEIGLLQSFLRFIQKKKEGNERAENRQILTTLENEMNEQPTPADYGRP